MQSEVAALKEETRDAKSLFIQSRAYDEVQPCRLWDKQRGRSLPIKRLDPTPPGPRQKKEHTERLYANDSSGRYQSGDDKETQLVSDEKSFLSPY